MLTVECHEQFARHKSGGLRRISSWRLAQAHVTPACPHALPTLPLAPRHKHSIMTWSAAWLGMAGHSHEGPAPSSSTFTSWTMALACGNFGGKAGRSRPIERCGKMVPPGLQVLARLGASLCRRAKAEFKRSPRKALGAVLGKAVGSIAGASLCLLCTTRIIFSDLTNCTNITASSPSCSIPAQVQQKSELCMDIWTSDRLQPKPPRQRREAPVLPSPTVLSAHGVKLGPFARQASCSSTVLGSQSWTCRLLATRGPNLQVLSGLPGASSVLTHWPHCSRRKAQLYCTPRSSKLNLTAGAALTSSLNALRNFLTQSSSQSAQHPVLTASHDCTMLYLPLQFNSSASSLLRMCLRGPTSNP